MVTLSSTAEVRRRSPKGWLSASSPSSASISAAVAANCSVTEAMSKRVDVSIGIERSRLARRRHTSRPPCPARRRLPAAGAFSGDASSRERRSLRARSDAAPHLAPRGHQECGRRERDEHRLDPMGPEYTPEAVSSVAVHRADAQRHDHVRRARHLFIPIILAGNAVVGINGVIWAATVARTAGNACGWAREPPRSTRGPTRGGARCEALVEMICRALIMIGGLAPCFTPPAETALPSAAELNHDTACRPLEMSHDRSCCQHQLGRAGSPRTG